MKKRRTIRHLNELNHIIDKASAESIRLWREKVLNHKITAKQFYGLKKLPNKVQTEFLQTQKGNFIYRHIIDGRRMSPRYYNVRRDIDLTCTHVEHKSLKNIFEYVGKSTDIETVDACYVGRDIWCVYCELKLRNTPIYNDHRKYPLTEKECFRPKTKN